MRILIGSNTPNDLRLGVARVMHFIGQEWEQMGHRVDYLYADDVPKIIPYGRLPWINYALGAVAVVRAREREGIQYDLLNLHSGDGSFVGLYNWIRGDRGRLVVTFHGVEELLWRVQNEEIQRGHTSKLPPKEHFARYILRRFQNSLATRFADCVMVLSARGRDFIVQRYRVNPKQIVVVPNGIEPQYFVTREYPRAASKLLFVGTWSWRKGKGYLIESLERLVLSHPDFTLSLVGTKEAESKVKSEFPDRLRSHVRVVPYAPNEQIQCEYRSHDVFVLPSMFEGFPLSMLEAMASGMPVVISDAAGAAREFIQPEQDGLLVPARDVDSLARAIGRLLDDVNLRRHLGLNAQRKVRELTWDNVAKRWMEEIQSVLAQGAN